MMFGCQSSIIHTSVDIHIDIQGGISIQGHSEIDIRKQQISISGYPWYNGHQSGRRKVVDTGRVMVQLGDASYARYAASLGRHRVLLTFRRQSQLARCKRSRSKLSGTVRSALPCL